MIGLLKRLSLALFVRLVTPVAWLARQVFGEEAPCPCCGKWIDSREAAALRKLEDARRLDLRLLRVGAEVDPGPEEGGHGTPRLEP